MYDKDSSGTLTIEEMKNYLGPHLSAELARCLKEADKDESGEMDFAEFKEFIFNNLNRKN